MSLEQAKLIEGVDFYADADLSKRSTLKLKARGDFALVRSEEALRRLLKLCRENGSEYRAIGWGANQVISRTNGTVFIKLDFPFDRGILKEPRERYFLPASAPLNALQGHAQKYGLKGWEAFTGIPASLGGAVYMNAGTALGEIGDVVESVRIMSPEGVIREVATSEDSFSYRSNNFVAEGEFILSAVLIHRGLDPDVSEQIKMYMDYRKKTQPLRSFTCGCVWKNKDAGHKAGLFADKTCLNNLASGALEVSSLHANFFENKGSATFEDFRRLADLLNDQMLLHTGIRFELEAKVY